MTSTPISPLRQRMIDDMNARKLTEGTQRGHLRGCKRFAAFLKRSPETATADDVRRFQLHLAETDVGICTRNGIMTGVKFLFRVTLRRHDLAAEIYHLREPQKVQLVMNQDEIKRAYRKLARKYHPDVSKEPDAESRRTESLGITEVHRLRSQGDREVRSAETTILV